MLDFAQDFCCAKDWDSAWRWRRAFSIPHGQTLWNYPRQDLIYLTEVSYSTGFVSYHLGSDWPPSLYITAIFALGLRFRLVTSMWSGSDSLHWQIRFESCVFVYVTYYLNGSIELSLQRRIHHFWFLVQKGFRLQLILNSYISLIFSGPCPL